MRMFRISANVKNLLDITRKVTKKIATIRLDQRGTSAIEFSFFAGLLSLGLLNMTDVSIYLYQRMELENATQMGVQVAWKNCDQNNGQLPATKNCPLLTTAITTAVQSTSLGTKVSLQSGSLLEGYFCAVSSTDLKPLVNWTNPLTTSMPPDCTAVGMSSLQPGDYIKITAQFAYAPLFPSITVAGKFATPITKTSLMRLN
jgi:hypothetical protein